MRMLRLMLSRHLERHFDGSGDAVFRRCGYRACEGGVESEISLWTGVSG
jgi:hypothetical protein